MTVDDFIGSLLQWLADPQNTATAVQALAAVVTAVATIVLWISTRTLAIETKVLSRMTSNPFVVAHIETSQSSAAALHLIIENTGNAAAFNVTCDVSPKIGRPNDMQTALDPGIDSFLIRVLPPGKKVPVSTMLSFEMSDVIFDLAVSWTAMPAEGHRETIKYKTSASDAYHSRWGDPVAGIAKSLEKIASGIAKK